MKIILKKKDGTQQEISLEEAKQLVQMKKASIDPVKCKTERVMENDKEVLKIHAPHLGKLIQTHDPNK